MLKVENGSSMSRWHIFDAKFSKPSSLWGNYPKEGPFTTMMSKYKTDVCGSDTSDITASLWLLSGRDPGQHLQYAELSSWASRHFNDMHSGIGALTPSYSCLNEVLGAILGVEGQLPSASENASAKIGQSDTKQISDTQSALSDSVMQPTTSTAANRKRPANKCLPLIVELYGIVEDSELLFKSRWSEMSLGIAHPLLRKSPQKGESESITPKQKCVARRVMLTAIGCRILKTSFDHTLRKTVLLYSVFATSWVGWPLIALETPVV